MAKFPSLTYYAITRGKEGVRPRTLHALKLNDDFDITLCGRLTDNSVSFVHEDDKFCSICYPEEG